jgi:hypothetical protein
MKSEVAAAAAMRPVAYVAVDDRPCRTRIVDVLQRLGWSIIEQPSAFHILCALSDAIEKDASAVHDGLLVVDEISRGCSGATLATGLADLGCAVPVVLVRDPWSSRVRESYGPAVHVVDRALAPARIAELARSWSPMTLTQRTPARARALA